MKGALPMKPLEGIRIVELGTHIAVPMAARLLADWGAEVIKVENTSGDLWRYYGLNIRTPISDEENPIFSVPNANKKIVSLNLKSEEGKQIALDLARWADVVVENFSAGTIKKLGLGYEDISKVNPNIIYASISGFGQSGPYSKKAAYDAIAQAMGGITYMTGYTDAPPVKVGPAISDAATGVHTATAILAALYYRERTGKGQYIDMAMMDTVFSMLENAVPIYTLTGVSPSRIGNANPGSAPYNMYHTKDGAVYISTANNSLFSRLIGVMGQPELIDDPRFCTNPLRKQHEVEIDAIVEAWTQQHTSADVERMLDEVAVPVASAKSVEQLIDDPQLLLRNMVIEQEVPDVGMVKFPGNPLKLQATPPDTSRRAPKLGEHTDEVLKEILHRSEEEIQHLKENSVV